MVSSDSWSVKWSKHFGDDVEVEKEHTCAGDTVLSVWTFSSAFLLISAESTPALNYWP